MVSPQGKESQLLRDPGHAASSEGLHALLRCAQGQVLRGKTFPSTESFSLFWSAQPGSAHGVEGGAGSGSLHKAVLSVSLSISSRMWPGRSLFAESECISGKMLRSGSETLELVSGQKHEETWYQ